MYTYDTWLNSCQKEKYFREIFREDKEHNITRDFNNFFFPENRAIYNIMCKNMVESDGSQMTI